MDTFNSPVNYTSNNLELEIIKRLRSLCPFIPDLCSVFRSLNGRFTVLYLDFTACPQELKTNKEQWLELARLITHSSHQLGLAHSVVFKKNDHIVLIANMRLPGYSQCWIV